MSHIKKNGNKVGFKKRLARQLRKMGLRKKLSHTVVDGSKQVKPSTKWKTYAVKGGTDYLLKGDIRSHSEQNPKGALLTVTFSRKDKSVISITEKYSVFSYSEKVGLFRYLPVKKEGFQFSLYFKIPEEAAYISLKFRTFKDVTEYTLSNVKLSFLSHRALNSKAFYNSNYNKLQDIFEKRGLAHLEKEVKTQLQATHDSSKKFDITLAAFNIIRTNDTYKASHYGEMAHEIDPSYTTLLKPLATCLRATGDIEKSLNLRKLCHENTKHDLSHFIRQGECEKNLLDNGFPISQREQCNYQHNKKVLYMLHNSLPYNSGGYATRSHGLLKGIKHHGYDVAACSRLGYPYELRKQGKTLPDEILPVNEIEGINYHRLHEGTLSYGDVIYSEYMQKYIQHLAELGRNLDINIYHAASNSVNGLAAIEAARINGKKSVYEVRGLWEITRLSRDPQFEGSDQYEMMCKLEAQACIEADQVICITHALKKIMVDRGVPSEKITIVSNATHTDVFSPLEKDLSLASELGIAADDVVIGYIGSIVNYEGLDLLLEAVQHILNKGITNFKCLIVGDGATLEELKSQAAALNLLDHVIFTGRVPHSEVNAYYSLVDVAPFPRKPYLVCEAVSPIKPFEAMAMEKAVIASSCAALTEIIKHQETGLIFEKGNSQDLADKILEYVQNPELRERIAKQARTWVIENKDWKHVAQRITGIYDSFAPKES